MTIQATRGVTCDDILPLRTLEDSGAALGDEATQQSPQPVRPDPDDLRRWTDEAAQQWSHTLARLAE